MSSGSAESGNRHEGKESRFQQRYGINVCVLRFNAFHAESKKPLHRESGFIRIQPGTSNVAFIIAQNSGLVEIEEGELEGQKLTLQSRAVARTSFAKQPYVQQISRVFQLRSDGRLEQTVFMALENQPLTQHLHITYRRAS
ncbi:hypothetical protein PDJAM_G00058880 [Pangasius djambal]|uniref:Uncharacterized protein n=1 Tax=Pangasius djambal TaxID=1691987 RepID=A0ACC5YXW3_9TELE|nr:hypothetical protein [Pangasius djambal]